MYEQFFGLNRPPFKITPDTSLFYDGGRRGDVLGALVYAVQRGEGIVKVVGEVGSGKTMLCRMLQQELPESVEIIYIANPSVSADDILFVIAHELKLDVQKDSSKHEVMHMLQSHLLKRFTGNQQVVLFVEEAQGMPLETLEEIRLLSNLETDQDKLLQIILFGQPELDDNLKTTSIRQLKERITHEFNLTPLSDDEIHSYLNFRMREVGYTGPEIISEKVAKVIGKYSGGLLRRINIMADKVLLAAFAEGTHDVNIKHVNAAVKDSGFERSIDGKLTQDNKGLYFVLVLIVLLLAMIWFSGKMNGVMPFGFDHSFFQKESPSMSVVEKSEPVNIVSQEVQRDVTTKSVVTKNVVVQDVVSQVEVKPEQIAEALLVEEVIEPKAITNTASAPQSDKSIKAEMALEDRLTSVIIRKKKNSASETLIKTEEIHKKAKIDQNSLLISPDNTKIAVSIADNKKSPLDPAKLNNADWLSWKLKQSKDWLVLQPDRGVSIQVMMRSKNASDELVGVLRSQWPLDIDKTYLYEVQMNDHKIYRIFYGGYHSLSLGQKELKELPEQLRLNQPYLHSIYKMKKTLL